MFDWNIIIKYLPILAEAAVMTVYISVISLALGLVLGLLGALGKLSDNKLIAFTASFYIWIIRSTPLLVQLFLIYFGLPSIGIELSPFMAGVIGLAVNVGAYNAETIRGGIEAIHSGQREAAGSLGMTKFQIMKRIILPQAIKIILPPLGNNFIILIKDTSLVSTITVVELTMRTQQLVGSTFKAFELYIAAAFLYAILTSTVAFMLARLTKKLNAKYSR
ncbi:MAG: amino acid ABC transporter permease [Ostreibacterium sp.]